MVTPFGTDIWLFDGPVVTGAAGFTYPTRMVVVRLADDAGLWVWSPVALSQEIRAQIDTLGPVHHLVAPNGLHHTFLAEWASAFPDARVHAAPGLTRDTAGTELHSILGDRPEGAWGDDLDHVLVRGNRITTEAVFLHRASSTVIVTDLLQQLPKDWYSGWRAVVARLDLMTAPAPTVPRKFRMATTDKPAAREAVTRILDWRPDRLVMAHGTPLTSGADAALRRAFAWLMR